jgi:type IV pilus assembly protein PilE
MNKNRGFTLVELLIVVAIIGILSMVALPSYRNYVVRASREAAQTEMMQMAALQEKIYLNANSYSVAANIIATAYTGQAAGGLGKTNGLSVDQKYTFTCPCTAQAFQITATPVNGSTQVGDGTITIDSTGLRQWNSASGLQTW